MTDAREASDSDDELDALQAPASELRSAAEQRWQIGGASNDSTGDTNSESSGDDEGLDEIVSPTNDLRPVAERTGRIEDLSENSPTDSESALNGTVSDDTVAEEEEGAMVSVYRNIVHQLRARSYEHAESWFAGVRVNQKVPFGVHRDAALLSRTLGKPDEIVSDHAIPYRVSLVTGDVSPIVRRSDAAVASRVRRLVQQAIAVPRLARSSSG